MNKRFGMFQVQNGKIMAIYPKLIEVFQTSIEIFIDDQRFELNSDYYIEDFMLNGEISVLAMYESGGKLFPMNVSECIEMGIQSPETEPLAIHRGYENIYSDPEFLRLYEEQKYLVAEILNAVVKREEEAPFLQVYEQLKKTNNDEILVTGLDANSDVTIPPEKVDKESSNPISNQESIQTRKKASRPSFFLGG